MAPDLTYTKIIDAQINGVRLIDTNWNIVMQRAIDLASRRLKNPKALSDIIVVNHLVGEKTDQGFKPMPETGVSVQRQDANNAWRAAAHIFKELEIPVEITFVWPDNPKAARPGEKSQFRLNVD